MVQKFLAAERCISNSKLIKLVRKGKAMALSAVTSQPISGRRAKVPCMFSLTEVRVGPASSQDSWNS
jgi:hypothetical protein